MAVSESNPYAPPKAVVADREADARGLKRRSVWLMILLAIVTLGLYYPVWYFRRRPGLNRLDSDRKVPLFPLLALAILMATQFLLGFLSAGQPLSLLIGETGALLLSAAQLVIGIMMIMVCFRIRDMIQDHASSDDPDAGAFDRVELSGVMTFFFSIFYLQWAINKYIVKA